MIISHFAMATQAMAGVKLFSLALASLMTKPVFDLLSTNAVILP